MSGLLATISKWLGRRAEDVHDVAKGGIPVSTRHGDDEHESSTNAQVAGADEQPWPDER